MQSVRACTHWADKIKEDGSGSGAVSLLRQHQPSLVRWLDERRSRGAESVTLGQFVDSFTNKGVSKQEETILCSIFRISKPLSAEEKIVM